MNDEGVIDNETDYQDAMIQSDYLNMLACSAINEAEELTEKTCADCGIPLTEENTVETKGWITYICKGCDEKRQKKRQEWLDKQNDEKNKNKDDKSEDEPTKAD